MRQTIRLFAESGEEPPSGKDAVETLLSASKFERLSGREDLLALARRLQPNPVETRTHAEIVYRISVTLRSRSLITKSEHTITEFLNNQTFESDDENHHILGLLSLSQAYNRIYRFDFTRAREESCKWRPSSDMLSDRDLCLLCDQLRTTGRILRGEGRFDEARHCFEGCLSTSGLPKSKRTLTLCHLSDVYCELEYMQRTTDSTSEPQLQHLNEARQMTECEIDRERSSNHRSRSFRRLLLSMTEIEIRQGHFLKAESLLIELLDIYGTLVELDVDDKVGHVRALISWARISQLHEAEHNWTAALLQNKNYNPYEEEVFTCAVIYLFISLVRFQCGNSDGSQDMFERAIEVFHRKRPQFLMPGLGTYLLDYVRSQLETAIGFVVPEIA